MHTASLQKQRPDYWEKRCALILAMRAEGKTFSAIGREMNVSRERVRQIILRANEKAQAGKSEKSGRRKSIFAERRGHAVEPLLVEAIESEIKARRLKQKEIALWHGVSCATVSKIAKRLRGKSA